MGTVEAVAADKRRQLIEDGFCVFEDVLPRDLLNTISDASIRLADANAEHDRVHQRSTGSLIDVFNIDGCADLIAFQGALDVLESMGFSNSKFTSGYIISKPPKSPPLFWHYDWACWGDPGAFDPVPQQLFLMYYLVDTHRENGCLRVVPKSHVEDNPFHKLLSEAHGEDLQMAKDLKRVEYQDRPDEVDICVKAGDLVIGDSRILHAAHANESDQRRTVITLWFHPDMHLLDEGTQAFIAGLSTKFPDHWDEETRARMEPIMARYDGDVDPLPWNRHRPNRG